MMKIEDIYRIFKQYPTISTDTRKIAPNSIFIALKGANFNGNKFAIDALNNGAKYAIIDEAQDISDDRLILVENTLQCLQKLANYHRNQFNIPIIGITGTNGKTTTKELIASVLSKKYKIIFTQGNLNNHIGVPLSLLQIQNDTEIAVIEMGANHPGEIDELCKIAEPNYGIITNVGKAHLEGFGSFEGVIKTKTELYRHLKLNDGTCFVNSSNDILMEHAIKLNHVTYGTDSNSDLTGEIADSVFKVVAKVLFPKGWLYLKSNLIGNYNFENILAACCIGLHFKLDPLEIQKAIEEYTPSNLRSQLIIKDSNKIILDAYNANPTSMTAAIQNFMKINEPIKTLILGDMLELGKETEIEHQKIADLVTSQNFENLFLIGKNFNKVKTGIKTKKFDNVELLSDYLIKQPLKNNLILIKGSRGISLEKILAHL